MRKKDTVLLLLLAVICVGCSPAKDVQKSETSEDIFAQYPKTVIEQEESTGNVTELYEWSGEKLQEKDHVNLEMYFMNMEATDSTVPSVSFEIKQPELFEPKQVDIAAKLSYKDTETTVQKLELSPFYTRLQAEAAFSDESYSYEITDETGTAAGFLGGNDNNFYYQGLPADCKKAGIAVIQYDQDAAYNRVSDVMEVELPESELK